MTTTNAKHIVTVEVIGDEDLKRFQQQAEQLGAKLRALNGQGMRQVAGGMNEITRSSGRMGSQLQNVSYQVADFAVQMSSGTSATRALSQQLPQLLAGFGVWGAVLGAAAAAAGALAPALLATKDSTQGLAEVTDKLDDAISGMRDSIDIALQPLSELTEEYGDAARGVQLLHAQLARLQKLRADTDIREASAQLSKLGVNLRTDLADIDKLLASRERMQRQAADGVATTEQLLIANEALALSQEALTADYGLSIEAAAKFNAEMAVLQKQIKDGAPSEEISATARSMIDLIAPSQQAAAVFGQILEDILQSADAVARLEAQTERLADLPAKVRSPLSGIPGNLLIPTEEELHGAAAATRDFTSAQSDLASSNALAENARELEAFKRQLEGYMTPAQQAQIEAERLTEQFNRFNDDLKDAPAYVEAYNRKMAELTAQQNAASAETQRVAEIMENSMNAAFASIIEGTKSVSDAFSDMLTDILADIAAFLVSRQVKSLINLLATQFGTGTALETPIAPGPLRATIPSMPANSPQVPMLTQMAAAPNMPATAYGIPRFRTPSGSDASVNVSVYNQVRGADIVVRETDGRDGSKEIEIMVQRTVKDMFGRGGMDTTLQTAFGIRRRSV